MTRFALWTGLAVLAAATAMALAATPLAAQGAKGAKWELTKQQKERAEKAKNPVASGQRTASAENGKKLAMQNCAPCHGQGGKGDGPGAAALPKKPADWTSKAVQEEKDGELFVKITDGNPPMPPWGSLAEKDRWDLVNYIRSLAKKS